MAAWPMTGGGGYGNFLVAPRAWAAEVAEMDGYALSEELPEGWLGRAEELLVAGDLSEGLGDDAVLMEALARDVRCWLPGFLSDDGPSGRREDETGRLALADAVLTATGRAAETVDTVRALVLPRLATGEYR